MIMKILSGILGLIVLYFLPTIVSWSKDHKYTVSIFALNFCLGWTVLIWFILLSYSFKKGA